MYNNNQRKKNIPIKTNRTRTTGNIAKSNSNALKPQVHTKNAAKSRRGFLSSIFGRNKNARKAEIIRYRSSIDYIFLILVIIMVGFGTIMVFSAGYAGALKEHGDSYFYVKKQLIMLSLGIVAMIIIIKIVDYRFLHLIAVPFFIGVMLLNFVTPIFGIILNGAPRWFNIFGFQFQPSEFLKTAVVLFFAYYISYMKDRMKKIVTGSLIPFAIILLIAAVMYLQSHFSGLIIIAAICIALMFIGESSWKLLGTLGGIGATVLYFIMTNANYASDRLSAWRDPYAFKQGIGYQTVQSILAIGSGGLLGVGLGQSRQKFLYLPEPQNDFIFSIICEELGFIGAMAVIFLFILFIWRGFVIAYHAPDKFSSLVVMGIVIKVAIQFALNIGVVTNAIPNTGISLPFFSYGGTALIVLLAEMGIILAISKYSYNDKT